MLVFSILDFTQNSKKVFDAALTDEVVINDDNGKCFKILSIQNDAQEDKSPFEDIPGIKLNIITQEIVEILRECRAGI